MKSYRGAELRSIIRAPVVLCSTKSNSARVVREFTSDSSQQQLFPVATRFQHCLITTTPPDERESASRVRTRHRALQYHTMPLN